MTSISNRTSCFLDLKVPLFNSFEFLEHLRENQGPPVIVLTASLNREDTQRAIKAGAEEYIVKPSDMDEFLNVIRNVLARWSSDGAEREGRDVDRLPRTDDQSAVANAESATYLSALTRRIKGTDDGGRVTRNNYAERIERWSKCMEF